MAFETLADFINMDGHGLYVWLAYAIGLCIFSFNVISPRLQKKQLIKEHQRKLRRERS